MNSKRTKRTMSFHIKLTLIMLCAMLIPLLTMFLTNRYSVQTQMVQQSSETYGTVLQHVSSYVADKAGITRSVVNMLCGDATVQQQLTKAQLQDDKYDGLWLLEHNQQQVLYSGYLVGSASRVYLYLNDHVPGFTDSQLYTDMTPERREAVDQWLTSPESHGLWLTEPWSATPAPRYVYFVAKIPSTKRLGVSLGLMQANILVSEFQDILTQATVSDSTALCLIDSAGNIFVQTGTLGISEDSLRSVAAQLDGSGTTDALDHVQVDGNAYMAGLSPVRGTGWHLLMLTPYSDIVSITNTANRILLLTMLLLLAIMVPLVTFIARAFTRPIRDLHNGVLAISQGNYAITVPGSREDEIGQTIDSFNLMIERTQEMMQTQYEMGQALKSAELKVLQEQINPHFLYNTLDLLHWQAKGAGASDIDRVVTDLSQFYKLSLEQGKEIVSIEHEILHVCAYTRIQNVRFLDKINLEIDIPEEIRTCQIVKMVLQPLVENSIQHGIREKDSESGTIRIEGRTEGDEIILSVSDDGMGMDAETLRTLTAANSDSYGVQNVNVRLILHYGQSAALRYQSTPGEGTCVTIRIPKIKRQ